MKTVLNSAKKSHDKGKKTAKLSLTLLSTPLLQFKAYGMNMQSNMKNVITYPPNK
jgi:hypothetical protein